VNLWRDGPTDKIEAGQLVIIAAGHWCVVMMRRAAKWWRTGPCTVAPWGHAHGQPMAPPSPLRMTCTPHISPLAKCSTWCYNLMVAPW